MTSVLALRPVVASRARSGHMSGSRVVVLVLLNAAQATVTSVCSVCAVMVLCHPSQIVTHRRDLLIEKPVKHSRTLGLRMQHQECRVVVTKRRQRMALWIAVGATMRSLVTACVEEDDLLPCQQPTVVVVHAQRKRNGGYYSKATVTFRLCFVDVPAGGSNAL